LDISARNSQIGQRCGEQIYFLSTSGPIDFLLTDVIMPKMNGRELGRRLGIMRPEMKVLYVSGDPDSTVRDGAYGAFEDGLAFLQKPYTRRMKDSRNFRLTTSKASQAKN
jgi:FixJ family two-component response regulator